MMTIKKQLERVLQTTKYNSCKADISCESKVAPLQLNTSPLCNDCYCQQSHNNGQFK